MKIFYRLLIISMFGAIYADCEDYATEADCGMHDECEWHADEMACEDAGGHDDHAHCEDYATEADCGMHDECEWHADEMACEDAGGHDDHAHCEDYATEVDCGMHDECEWHADEMACEDAGGHDDHAHCEDYATEADCGMHDECEWHADEMACEDAGGHDDHAHCEDYATEVDCGMHDECEWHADEMACEDAGGHDDHAHCEDYATEADCGMHDECEWHADEMACEDAGGHDDHAHCEDYATEADCGMHDECEWHADEMACEDAGGHDDHAHCEDYATEADCGMHDECEWHDDHCEDAHDHGDGDCADTNHFDTDGLGLEHDGMDVYSQFQGLVEGSVELHVGETKDFSVHFLDNSGNEVVIDESNIECYGLSFNITDSDILSIEMEGHDDDHGHDDHEGGHHSFEATGLGVGSTTFTISIIHQGHADYTSLPILVNVTEEDACIIGDVNGDTTLSILDIVAMVSGVVNGNTDSLECGDYTGDGIVDILDIVQLVQFIINNITLDATSATININESNVTLEADGYIGGVQMTLSHNSNFTLELTEDAYIAQSNTELNETILVVVNPESDMLFKYEGDFIITEYTVANSQEHVSTTISEMKFNLGATYPNPFNPTTTLSLTIPASGYVNVTIYNLVGQQIANLVDGNMDLGTYNLTWNAQSISSGIYLVRAEYAGNVSTQKLMLIK